MENVEPIGARQTGELARLLEERGCGAEYVQKMIENPGGLIFFLLGGFEKIASGDVTIVKNVAGLIWEVKDKIIFGISPSSKHYAEGRILRIGSRVTLRIRGGNPPRSDSEGLLREIRPFDKYDYDRDNRILVVEFHSGIRTLGIDDVKW